MEAGDSSTSSSSPRMDAKSADFRRQIIALVLGAVLAVVPTGTITMYQTYIQRRDAAANERSKALREIAAIIKQGYTAAQKFADVEEEYVTYKVTLQGLNKQIAAIRSESQRQSMIEVVFKSHTERMKNLTPSLEGANQAYHDFNRDHATMYVALLAVLGAADTYMPPITPWQPLEAYSPKLNIRDVDPNEPRFVTLANHLEDFVQLLNVNIEAIQGRQKEVIGVVLEMQKKFQMIVRRP